MYDIRPYPTDAADSVARAIASGLLGLGSILQAGWRRHAERRRERLGLKELRSLPDFLLRDIGLSRYDLASAVKIPPRNRV